MVFLCINLRVSSTIHFVILKSKPVANSSTVARARLVPVAVPPPEALAPGSTNPNGVPTITAAVDSGTHTNLCVDVVGATATSPVCVHGTMQPAYWSVPSIPIGVARR